MQTSVQDNKLRFNGQEITVPEKHMEFVKNLMEQAMFDKNDELVVLPAKKIQYRVRGESRCYV